VHLRKILPRAVLVVTVVTSLVAALTTAASAAPAKTGVITIDGQSFPVAPLVAAQKYVTMNDSTTEIQVLPQAKKALSAATYRELTAVAAALNSADAKLRTAQAKAQAAAPTGTRAPAAVRPNSPCTDKFHSSWGTSTMTIYIPDCMAYGFAAVVGGPAAVAAFIFSEIGPIEWAAAVVVAGAILAAAAVLASWAGWCDIFGAGNGVRFVWHWIGGPNSTSGYPTFGCW